MTNGCWLSIELISDTLHSGQPQSVNL